MPKSRNRVRKPKASTSRLRETKPIARPPRRALGKIFALLGVLLAATVTFAMVSRWNIERNTAHNAARAPQPLTTPEYAANAPAREYVYAGSKLLALSQPENPPPADLAVWRPSNGTWYVMGGQGSQYVTQGWGLSGDVPVPGDYDGDEKTDFSVFRPGENKWYVFFSSDSTSSTMEWGVSGDVPAQADYDGDGKTDRAVFRQNDPSSGVAKWYVFRSGDSTQFSQQYGINGDKPAPADHDGDGRADLVLWRASNTNFYAYLSGDGSQQTIDFSDSSTEPVSGDYDGDNKADYAIKSGNSWIIRSSITGTIASAITWQQSGDIPVPNDYDGDGKCDIAVWRDSNGNWYIRQSTLVGQSGELRQVGWGLSGDTPVPAYYRR